MSAEIPTPKAAKPSTRSRLVKSNRRQMLLFAALTVVLTVVTVRLHLKIVANPDSAKAPALPAEDLDTVGLQWLLVGIRSSSAMNSCATNSPCGARA